MYPENPERTQVIVGSMNMGYISEVAGQNVTGQNVTDKMSRTKCYVDKMTLDKMSRTKCRGQNVVGKI